MSSNNNTINEEGNQDNNNSPLNSSISVSSQDVLNIEISGIPEGYDDTNLEFTVINILKRIGLPNLSSNIQI